MIPQIHSELFNRQKAVPEKIAWLSPEDEINIKRIHSQIILIDPKETTFVQVELLFYETFAILRNYNGVAQADHILYKLGLVKENEYKRAQNPLASVSYRVAAIKTFKNSLREVLRFAIKTFLWVITTAAVLSAPEVRFHLLIS